MNAQEAIAHAPDGGTWQRLQTMAIPPIEGAPFSATVVTEWTRILPDGSLQTVKNHRLIARDSTGRVFQERRNLTPTGDQQVTVLAEVDYQDPARHEAYVCVPARRVCEVYRLNVAPQQSARAAGPLPNGMGSVTQESLGTQTIEDVEVIGSREITTLRAGVAGTQKAEPTVKEFWYSPRLRINMITKRFDPHASAIQNFELRQISLSEPDPKLFVPPSAYRLIQMDVP